MTADDRTTEALLARRALAEKATQGPWNKSVLAPGYIVHCDKTHHETIASLVEYASDRSIAYTFVNAAANAAHISANDPTTVLADIDEILRLREENEKLKQSVEVQRGMVQAALQTAALAWGGDIPSPLPGHRSMTEEEVAAMFEHLNCPWCGGSGHVEDCEEADQQVKSKLERLDKEADCLATWLANAYIDCSSLPEIDNGMSPPDPYQVREAARKAVENATEKR